MTQKSKSRANSSDSQNRSRNNALPIIIASAIFFGCRLGCICYESYPAGKRNEAFFSQAEELRK